MNPFKLFKLKNEVETALELAINDQGEIVDESALALWENSLEAKNAYRDWETDRKSTRLNSSHITRSRMPSSA